MLSFSESVALHHTHLRAKRRSPATIAWYDDQFTAYRRWQTARCVGDQLPTADQIEEYLADSQDVTPGQPVLAPSTVNARFRALRALFFFLERRKKIKSDDNPMHQLDAPSVPKKVRPYVKVAELHALLATCGHDWIGRRDQLILLLLFYSGLRLGELVALRVEDVDTHGLELTIHHGKGDKARVVPLAPEVRPALAAYLLTRPEHRAELWLASDGYGGAVGVLKAEGIRQMIFRRCAKAGLPRMNPHRFRHGFAMWMINGGARLTTVSTAMGHSDPAVTAAVYAHTTTTTVRVEYEAARKALNR